MQIRQQFLVEGLVLEVLGEASTEAVRGAWLW